MNDEFDDPNKSIYLHIPSALRQRIIAYARSHSTDIDHVRLTMRSTVDVLEFLLAIAQVLDIRSVSERRWPIIDLDWSRDTAEAKSSVYISPDEARRMIDEGVAHNEALLLDLIARLKDEGVRLSVKRVEDDAKARVDVYLSLGPEEARAIAEALERHQGRRREDLRTMSEELRDSEQKDIKYLVQYYEKIIRSADFPMDEATRAGKSLAEMLISLLGDGLDTRELLEVPDRATMVDSEALAKHIRGPVSKTARLRLRECTSKWANALMECAEADIEQERLNCIESVEGIFRTEIARMIGQKRGRGRRQRGRD